MGGCAAFGNPIGTVEICVTMGNLSFTAQNLRFAEDNLCFTPSVLARFARSPLFGPTLNPKGWLCREFISALCDSPNLRFATALIGAL